MDRGGWWPPVHGGIKELDMTEVTERACPIVPLKVLFLTVTLTDTQHVYLSHFPSASL